MAMTPEAEITEFVEGRKRTASEIAAMKFRQAKEPTKMNLNPSPPPAPAIPPDYLFRALVDLAHVIAKQPKYLEELRGMADLARAEQQQAKADRAAVSDDLAKAEHTIANARTEAEAALRKARDEADEYSKQAKAAATYKENVLADREAKLTAAEREVAEMKAELKRRLDAIRAAAA